MSISVARAVVFGTILASTALACGSFGSIYSSSGVADTTSPWLELPAGQYAIMFTASDREPWLGCEFGVDVARQPPDPLAPGVAVIPANEIRIRAKGQETGTIPVSIVEADTYFLRIHGTCEWEVHLSRR